MAISYIAVQHEEKIKFQDFLGDRWIWAKKVNV